jgi:hypothetical protein
MFTSGDFKGAADAYSSALGLSPDSSTLYANRAIARLRMSDGKGALSDASTAVALDPKNHKAMFRRAQVTGGVLRSLTRRRGETLAQLSALCCCSCCRPSATSGLLQATRNDLTSTSDIAAPPPPSCC